MTLTRNLNDSLTLTQPSPVRSIQEHFFKDDPVPITILPLPKDWSPINSKYSPRGNLKKYQQDLGTVAYMRLTMGESNTISLLSAQAKDPSELDLHAVRHFAAFIVTRRNVGLTFYPSKTPTNINVCTPIHCFTDASPGDNLDGAAQLSYLIKMGDVGHPGGAFIQRNSKQPGLVSDSVPAAELAAYQMMAKAGIWCRHLSERFAGVVPKATTDLTVPNSPPPTWIGIDSGSVQSLLSNENGSGKGLRSYNRVINHLRSLAREKLFNPVAISTEDQLADIGTKQFKSPTLYWRSAAGAIGDHPALRAMQNLVRDTNGRSQKTVQPMDTEDNPVLAEKVQVHTLINHPTPPTDTDTEDFRLGTITMENTRLNADRDNQYRQQIQDHVRSGNGHLIARGFATSQEELDFITHTIN